MNPKVYTVFSLKPDPTLDELEKDIRVAGSTIAQWEIELAQVACAESAQLGLLYNDSTTNSLLVYKTNLISKLQTAHHMTAVWAGLLYVAASNCQHTSNVHIVETTDRLLFWTNVETSDWPLPRSDQRLAISAMVRSERRLHPHLKAAENHRRNHTHETT